MANELKLEANVEYIDESFCDTELKVTLKTFHPWYSGLFFNWCRLSDAKERSVRVDW